MTTKYQRVTRSLAREILDDYDDLRAGHARGQHWRGLNSVLVKKSVHPWAFYRFLKRPENEDLNERYAGLQLQLDVELAAREEELMLTPAAILQEAGEDYRQCRFVQESLKRRAAAAKFHQRETPIVETSLDVRRVETSHEASGDLGRFLGAFASISDRLLAPSAEVEAVDAEHQLVAEIDLDSPQEG